MNIYAASVPDVSFDPEGNLLMITTDRAATGGIRYKTIGWTVKKEDKPISQTISARLPLSQTGAKYMGDGTVRTYFETPAETVMAAIYSVSTEWAQTLAQSGGYVYLDAIMIVVVNDVPLGSMNESGQTTGSVYFTREGIAGAESWSDPAGLYSHFGIRIHYPAIEIHEDEEEYVYTYGKDFCRQNSVEIRAESFDDPEFDVNDGIPTGEKVCFRGTLQKYYFTVRLKKYTGTASSQVVFCVFHYDDEGEEHVSRSTVSVQKDYSYYRVSSLSLYRLDSGFLTNDAMENVTYDFTGIPYVSVSVKKNRGTYRKSPEKYEYWVERDEYSEYTSEDKKDIANIYANEIPVRNDELIIDGFTVLDGEYTEGEAADINIPDGPVVCEVTGGGIQIPHTRANKTYVSTGMSTYKKYNASNVKNIRISDINDINVHTPVVCDLNVTDDKRHNQQKKPTEYVSFVLGRDFGVTISYKGEHRQIKGYGNRDYEKYVSRLQICFPFEVYVKNELIAKDTWIDLKNKEQSFYLPVGTEEGAYKIRARCFAANYKAAEKLKTGLRANLSEMEYIAQGEAEVYVTGRMYDLSLTGVYDYPRWENVFKDNFRYRAGRLSMEGEVLEERAASPYAPILYGSHPYDKTVGPVGLGYTVSFELRTIGSMREDDDKIVITPRFYYMERDGSNRCPVKLYKAKDLSEIKGSFVLSAKNRIFKASGVRNVSDKRICNTSVQVWRGTFRIDPDVLIIDESIDLGKYIEKECNGRFSARDPAVLKGGFLTVVFDILSVNGGKVNLSYTNLENEKNGYANMWRDQGFLYERTDAGGVVFHLLNGEFLVFDTKYTIYSDYESYGTH